MCNETSPSEHVSVVEPRPSYSEDEPPPINDSEKFLWRGNRDETFSDWTIVIVANKQVEEDTKDVARGAKQEAEQEDDGGGDKTAEEEKVMVETVSTFHVHKGILSYGMRKSEYFARLFRSKFNESNSNISRIELDPLAASAFPILLDYIYAPETPLAINTNTATALHSLGEYFEIRHLRWDARQFCLRDMSLTNIGTYYEHCMMFGNESILAIVAQFMGKNLLQISPASPIVKKAEPGFWVKTLNAARKDGAQNENEDFLKTPLSLHWSKLMCEIGTLNAEVMEKGVFDELTNASNMPDVHEDVALVLCELDDGLHPDDNPAKKAHDESQPRPLQKRCGVALAQTWKGVKHDEDTVRLLERRKPSFLVALLLKSLEKAKAALEVKENQLEYTRNELRRCQNNAKSLSISLLTCQEELRAAKDLSPFFKKWKPLTCQSVCTDYIRDTFPKELTEHYPSLASGNAVKAVCRLSCSGPVRPVFYYDPDA